MEGDEEPHGAIGVHDEGKKARGVEHSGLRIPEMGHPTENRVVDQGQTARANSGGGDVGVRT